MSLEADRGRLLELLRSLSFERRKVILASGQGERLLRRLQADRAHRRGARPRRAAAPRAHPRASGRSCAASAASPSAPTPSRAPSRSRASSRGEPIDAFIVRKEPKGHGTGQWIEGRKTIPDGSRVVGDRGRGHHRRQRAQGHRALPGRAARARSAAWRSWTGSRAGARPSRRRASRSTRSSRGRTSSHDPAGRSSPPRALSALAAAASTRAPRCPRPARASGPSRATRATRRTVLYDRFKHRATATATHLSLPVREARARRLAEWLGWTPAELEARLAAERARARGRRGVRALASTRPTAARTTSTRRSSVWRVALKTGGEDLLATRVDLDRLRRDHGRALPVRGPVRRGLPGVPAEGPRRPARSRRRSCSSSRARSARWTSTTARPSRAWWTRRGSRCPPRSGAGGPALTPGRRGSAPCRAASGRPPSGSRAGSAGRATPSAAARTRR